MLHNTRTITLVTGNAGKLAEWKRLMPDEFILESDDIDLDEIQSLDLEMIIADKARRAYERINGPVIVEDVAAGLDRLGGLPGPFIKFFEKQLGLDALFQLARTEGEPATVRCAVAYFDGTTLLPVISQLQGTTVSPRGENGFGFDKCFVPAGQSKTFGEMSPAEKDAISHRAMAVRELARRLREQSVGS